MIRILLDTNFLMLLHKKRLDIFSEIEQLFPEKHELVTLSSVIRELETLSAGVGDDSAAAKTALRLIESKRVGIIESEGPADRSIEDYARRENAVVCTNDRTLKRKLKARKVQTVSLQGEDKLTT
jgi:rRNA-processing protein FCF1